MIGDFYMDAAALIKPSRVWRAVTSGWKWYQLEPRVPLEYSTRVREFDLPEDGKVQYAQWLHPKESRKEIRQETVTVLRRYVAPGDFVIDIGAHTGDTSVPLALAAGPTGLTLALEPNPFVFKVLAQNAGLNQDRTRIVPLPFAATSADGEFTFFYSDPGCCNGGDLASFARARRGHRHAIRVQGRNLSAVLRQDFGSWLPRLSLIKVDTEGRDLDVLVSLEEIIRAYRPVLICEVFRDLDAAARRGFHGYLESLGYRAHSWRQNGPIGSPLGEDGFLRGGHFDFIALPKDCSPRAAT